MKSKSHAGASLLTLSRALAPMVIVGAGATCGAPAQAQSFCTPNALGIVICTGSPTVPPAASPAPAGPIAPVLDIVDSVTPVAVVLQDGFQSPQSVGVSTIVPGADIDIGALGTAAINTLNQPGLLLDSAARLNAQVTSITTTGDGATGALLRAVDDAVFVSDGAVSTLGRAAPALDLAGRSVDVDANILRTASENSQGAILNGLDGPVRLTADLIETSSGLSNAAVIRSAGDATLQGGALRTNGTDALAFTISNDAAACVLLGNNGCTTNVGVNEVTTNGFGSIGGLVRAAGNTAIDIGVLRTGGDQAAGLDLSTDPQACILLGVGSCGTTFTVQNLTTSGARSPGALLRAGGPIAANVGVLETAGNEAVGLDLASQPEICAVLGAGSCGSSFSVGQLTTSGVGATGVLARIAGPTTGNVGVLRTSGNDAAGIDIASDPTICAIVGAGACDVNLVGQQVSTGGDGAAAVLIGAIGNVTTNLGAITTSGDNSTGLGIRENPVVCLALGPGNCRVTAVTGPVDTGGDNSPGVDVGGGGDPVTVGTGPVNTGGESSPGVVVTNPGPTELSTGPVTTGGDDSAGVLVNGGSGNTTVVNGPVTTTGGNSTGVDVSGTGPITIDAGTVSTGGATSPGIEGDGGAGPIIISFDDVSTRGPDSSGVDVTGTGPITINGGTVATGGDRSDGITVAGGTGPVLVDVDRVTTGGIGSDGIVVATESGDQAILAGPITTIGSGANGIVATSPGCSTISITARDDISAVQGAGILASSACAVSVTTLPGASVTGGTAGIDVTSSTGSTIVIGDAVSSVAGPAIDADGAGATVNILRTGSVSGAVDLTDGNDALTNDGTFNATSNSNFGGGADSFVNRAGFAVRQGATTPGNVTLAGLESFTNSGTLDMRNGVVGDTLTLPGSFAGAGASTLELDLSVTPAGATADRLVIGGAATGITTISLAQPQDAPGVLVNNLVVVDAGNGSSPTAFVLGSAAPLGLVSYGLSFDPANNVYALFGTPNASAYRIGGLASGARELFYRTDDAIGTHLQEQRDALGSNGEDTPQRSSALWGQLFGSANRSTSRPTVTAFGHSQAVSLDNTQNFFGGQLGYDLGDVTGRGAVFGITGGYASSTLNYSNSADRLGYQSLNGGVYAGVNAGAFFLNGIAKYEHYWIDLRTPSAGIRRNIDGNGYGGRLEAGVRLRSQNFFVEPAASIDYVRTDLGRLNVAPATLTFDDADGLRGKAGARVGVERTAGASTMTFYVSGRYVHEFKADDRTAFASGGQVVNLRNRPLSDYGRGTLGFTISSGTQVSGFLEAFGDYGERYKGGGGRGGLSIKF